MQVVMSFIQKKLKIILLILILSSGTIVTSGYFHYRALNRTEDPRIVDARKIMVKYNKLMSENETGLALLILNQVEDIYMNTLGYSNSFELGVIENNRGSIYLIKAETDLINEDETKESNLILAERYITNSIDIYTGWLERVDSMEREDIREMVLLYFREDDSAFNGFDLEKIINKRVDDIMASKTETKRRLSVSHTNLGIIRRYEGNLEKAMEQYEKAVELWPDNHVAKDNINQLLGRPLEKRNIIKQMFFKDRM
jgi:tetratricopeptide (TPR) repeat protein